MTDFTFGQRVEVIKDGFFHGCLGRVIDYREPQYTYDPDAYLVELDQGPQHWFHPRDLVVGKIFIRYIPDDMGKVYLSE